MKNKTHNFFMIDLSSSYIKFFVLRFYKVLLIILLFFSSCSASKNEQSFSEEDLQTHLFLEHVMIREGGLYVLLGSKPMVEFDVQWAIPKTLEEKKADYEKMRHASQEWDEERTKNCGPPPLLSTFKDFSLNCDKQKPYTDHKRLWNHWKGKSPKISSTKFRFIERTHPISEEKIAFFINVPNSIFILKKYHSDFVKETGMEFDPFSVLDDFPNTDSLFWNRVLKNHSLYGLLLGYGERSSFLFDWYRKHDLENPAISQSMNKRNDWAIAVTKEKVTLNDLPLPPFVLFSIYDESKDHYKKERKKIIKLFEKQDFVSLVMHYLND